MNRSSIEWTDYTWNPVTGCKHGCTYCYARRLAEGRLKGRFGYDNGFEPTFHANRLQEPKSVKKPSMIFTCSMGDLFGDWVPSWWIGHVFVMIKCTPQHQFQILTKNPKRLALQRNIPPNAWLGTSIDGLGESIRRMDDLRSVPTNGHIKFVSFEPLLADVASHPDFNLEGIDWVIIGAQTGPGAKQPERGWYVHIIREAIKAQIPLFIKNNLEWPPDWTYKVPNEFPISQSKGEATNHD